MWLNELRQRLQGRTRKNRRNRSTGTLRRKPSLFVELLEDRHLPSTFSAATVGDLISDINAANAKGGHNTIILTSAAYTLTAVNNSTDGPTGLPVIAAGDNLTISGNGALLARSAATGTPAFRFFDVASDGLCSFLAELSPISFHSSQFRFILAASSAARSVARFPCAHPARRSLRCLARTDSG